MNTERPIKKVLLIDDDADDRKYFADALQEIDPSVECMIAKDGEQGWQMLQKPDQTLPDLVFLDLRMPRYSGRQCLSNIKADERLKEIPVIIYTTSKEVDDAEELSKLGADHFISKPSNTSEIYYVLSMALEGHLSNRGVSEI